MEDEPLPSGATPRTWRSRKPSKHPRIIVNLSVDEETALAVLAYEKRITVVELVREWIHQKAKRRFPKLKEQEQA